MQCENVARYVKINPPHRHGEGGISITIMCKIQFPVCFSLQPATGYIY